ncbi:MAG: hypothetical protein ACRECY_08380, partial [Phyllobacterium sp.]
QYTLRTAAAWRRRLPGSAFQLPAQLLDPSDLLVWIRISSYTSQFKQGYCAFGVVERVPLYQYG